MTRTVQCWTETTNTLTAFKPKTRGKQPTTLVFRPQSNKSSRCNEIPT